MRNLPKIQDYDHWLFLLWLFFTTVFVYAFVICWFEGYVHLLGATDKSHVSLLIAILFIVGCLHCAIRSLYLSNELDNLSILEHTPSPRTVSICSDTNNVRIGNNIFRANTLLADYLAGVVRQKKNTSNEASTESNEVDLLIAKAKGNHDIGWHLVDVLLKLGLIGTIVGFILMLSSVANTESLDVDSMQTVLKQMSSGMGTALFTTLAGMVASILLGVQYLILDKGADLLIENTIEITEQLDIE